MVSPCPRRRYNYMIQKTSGFLSHLAPYVCLSLSSITEQKCSPWQPCARIVCPETFVHAISPFTQYHSLLSGSTQDHLPGVFGHFQLSPNAGIPLALDSRLSRYISRTPQERAHLSLLTTDSLAGSCSETLNRVPLNPCAACVFLVC